MSRTVFISLLTVAAALLAGGCELIGRTQPQAEASRPPTAVEILTVRREEIVEQRQYTGDVLPWEKLGLCFKVGGRVARIVVEEGQQVRKGQLVAELDSTDYRLTRDLARTQVEALRPHLERARQLRSEQVVVDSTLEELESKMRAARIQLRQAEAQLSYTRLRAPMDGTVVRRMLAPGDMVGTSRAIVAVVDLSRAKVVLPVPQADLLRLSEGQQVTVSAPGLKQPLSGRIHKLGYVADSSTRTFPVTVEVPNPDLELRAGMVAEVQLMEGTRRGIFVPLDVVSRDLGGQPRVLVLDESGSTVRSRQVEPGGLHGGRLEILKGLRPGDRLVLRGMVLPGDPIVVVQPSASTGEPGQQPASASAEGGSGGSRPDSAERTPAPNGGAADSAPVGGAAGSGAAR